MRLLTVLSRQANRDEESVRDRQDQIDALNRSLDGPDARKTLALLKRLLCLDEATGSSASSAELTVLDEAAALYHEEMSHFRMATGEHLSYEMICGAVRTLTLVAQVTRAVETRKVTELLFALEEPLLSFDGVNTSQTESYMAALTELRKQKIQRNDFCSVLTHTEIQSCITQAKSSLFAPYKMFNFKASYIFSVLWTHRSTKRSTGMTWSV